MSFCPSFFCFLGACPNDNAENPPNVYNLLSGLRHYFTHERFGGGLPANFFVPAPKLTQQLSGFVFFPVPTLTQGVLWSSPQARFAGWPLRVGCGGCLCRRLPLPGTKSFPGFVLNTACGSVPSPPAPARQPSLFPVFSRQLPFSGPGGGWRCRSGLGAGSPEARFSGNR